MERHCLEDWQGLPRYNTMSKVCLNSSLSLSGEDIFHARYHSTLTAHAGICLLWHLCALTVAVFATMPLIYGVLQRPTTSSFYYNLLYYRYKVSLLSQIVWQLFVYQLLDSSNRCSAASQSADKWQPRSGPRLFSTGMWSKYNFVVPRARRVQLWQLSILKTYFCHEKARPWPTCGCGPGTTVAQARSGLTQAWAWTWTHWLVCGCGLVITW